MKAKTIPGCRIAGRVSKQPQIPSLATLNFSVALFLASMISVLTAQSFELRLLHRPDSATAPFELRWPSSPGKTYDVWGVEELGSPWKSLLKSPIMASGPETSWVDSEPGSKRFYLVVEQGSGGVPEAPLETLDVIPSRAELAPGGQQVFRVSNTPASLTKWTLLSPAGTTESGVIDSTGKYTAPVSIPEVPVVLLRASRSDSPRESGYAVITLMPPGEATLTREQASEIVRTTVLEKVPAPDDAAMFGLHNPLDSGDLLESYRPPGTVEGATSQTVRLRGSPRGSWYFLVDQDPLSGWLHSVIHVLVDAGTGEVTQRPDTWYALLNGNPVLNLLGDRLESGDLIQLGANVKRDLTQPARTAESATPDGDPEVKSGFMRAAEIPLIPRTFTPDQQACPCSDGTRYHAVLAVLSPEEKALVQSARAMEAVFKGNRFSVTTLTTGGSPQLVNTLSQLRTSIRPCDVLVVMVFGHGSLGSVQGMSASSWAESFRQIPTNARYLIIEACDAGWIFEQYAEEGRILGVPNATIFTATDKSPPDSIFTLTGKSPIYNGTTLLGGPSVFTDAFISCLSGYDKLEDVHACLTSNFDLPLVANRLKLAGPRLARLGDPDSDHDGIVDKTESNMGFDPKNSDSDGDGICDGIEWGRFPAERILNLKRIAITTLPNLGEFSEGSSIAISLGTSNAVPFTTTPVSTTNPFGANPTAGWRLAAGSQLPANISLDRTRGRLSGRLLTSGQFKFKLEYMDAAGALASREFSMIVRPPPAGSTASVLVSTATDGNIRDDHITLREALLLASGDLTLAQLRPDPNPEDGIGAGEQRWVTGLPGYGSLDTIQTVFGSDTNFFVLDSLGPLRMTGLGDHLMFDRDRVLSAARGPALVVAGTNNIVDNGLRIFVDAGPGIRIEGWANKISTLHFLGTSSTTGLEVNGMGHSVQGAAFSGLGLGIRINGTESAISGGSIERCGEGIRIENGATLNTISDVSIGYKPAESTSIPAQRAPIQGIGVLFSPGSQSNLVQNCTLGSCGAGAVALRGPGTAFNQILQCTFGNYVSGSTTNIGPNLLFGIALQEGARENRITGGTFSGNLGPAILLAGTGTTGNIVESSPQRLFGPEITSSQPDVDAVRVEAGAGGNSLQVRVLQSLRNGVVFSGAGTRSNQLTATIRKAADAGVRLESGATDNTIASANISESGTGCILSGPATRRNTLRSLSLTQNLGDGLRWEDGAGENRAGPNLNIADNKGHGIVLDGAGTDRNVIDGTASTITRNGGHGLVFRNGASQNQASGLRTSNNKLGSALFTGRGTSGNQLLDSFLTGGLFPAEVAATGPGAVITDGASGNAISRNSILSHGREGVWIQGSTTTSNLVASTLIQANLASGIHIDNSPGNRIGGEAMGNTIVANGAEGIRIAGAEASGNRIAGNTIGASRQGNASHGVLIHSGARDNRIGGPRVVRQDPRSPAVLLRPSTADRGSGNRISSNLGDGVRVEGTGTRDNRVQGNFIGALPGWDGTTNSTGEVTISEAASATRLGNAARLDANNPRLGNLIGPHPSGSVQIRGSGTKGHSIRRNEILAGSAANRLALQEGGNGGPRNLDVEVDWAAGVVRGTAPAAGILELFSDFPGDEAVYHFAVRVGAGRFEVDSVEPGRSTNARFLDRQRPVRRAAHWATFTETGSGSTSAQVTLE